MRAGMVVDIKEKKAVVLVSGGNFVTVPAKKGWQRGDMVSLSDPFLNLRQIRMMAACFLLVVLCSSGGLGMYYTKAAYVSVDVNPSIELELNRFDRVISVKAWNKEGEEVLEKLSLKNQNYQSALKEILNQETVDGYLKQRSDVVLAVFAKDDKKESALYQGAQSAANDELERYGRLEGSEVHIVDRELVHAAHSCGVSAGKYLYVRELKELKPEIDVENYCHRSIGQIKQQIASCHENSEFDSQQRGGGHHKGSCHGWHE